MSESTLAAPSVAAVARKVAPAPLSPPQAPARPPGLLEPLRRFALLASNQWLPRVTWTLSGTGKPGLVGVALIAASVVFLASTQLRVADEVLGLKTDLAAARARGGASQRSPADNASASIRELPARGEMPALLGSLLVQADAARLTIDTGKYEMTSTKAGEIVRYKVSFPVTGPYPQVRQFIDSTLKMMPTAAISELSIERKAISDGAVEAQIRLTVFTRSTP